jgi:hypothetical protein
MSGVELALAFLRGVVMGILIGFVEACGTEFTCSIGGYGRGERAQASGTRQIRGCQVTLGGHQGPVDLFLTA